MPEPFAAFPDVMNVRELAAALHLSRAGAYNLMNAPDFPTLKIGGAQAGDEAGLDRLSAPPHQRGRQSRSRAVKNENQAITAARNGL